MVEGSLSPLPYKLGLTWRQGESSLCSYLVCFFKGKAHMYTIVPYA